MMFTAKPYVQPVVEIGPSRCQGCDAVVTWRHGSGMVPRGTTAVPAPYADGTAADRTVQVTRWFYYEYDSARCSHCGYYVFHPWDVNIMGVQGYAVGE